MVGTQLGAWLIFVDWTTVSIDQAQQEGTGKERNSTYRQVGQDSCEARRNGHVLAQIQNRWTCPLNNTVMVRIYVSSPALILDNLFDVFGLGIWVYAASLGEASCYRC